MPPATDDLKYMHTNLERGLSLVPTLSVWLTPISIYWADVTTNSFLKSSQICTFST